jgi:rSAM/selenodomain-associated transferase 1
MRSRAKKALRRSAAPFACRLVIMAKVPVAGAVKRRLAREVGEIRAVWFYRHAAAAMMARLGRQPFWRAMLAVTPDAGRGFRPWPRGLARRGQGRGDLGERMLKPMRELPAGPVCVIGTDIPDVEIAHVRRAFRQLGSADVVFGPAEDGGFWLVGMRRRPRLLRPFAGVRWSTADALADTLRNLEGARVAYTATLADVDTGHDLARAGACFGRRVRVRHALRIAATTQDRNLCVS